MPHYLNILVIVALFAGAGAQIIGDFDCTTVGTQGNYSGQLVYSPLATICGNTLSDSGCKVLYNGGNASNVSAETNAPRPSACFTTVINGTTVDPTMKDAAIKNCPKDPAWRQPIANSCPNKCGMCQMGGCVDKAIDCSVDTSICNNINLQAFVNENCQRTCQRCLATTTIGFGMTTPFGGSCTDVSSK
ncbi:hypothetical protein WR25_23217 [Diploscapter pachys]|uniref:ShKT domain-containing protein n=1 Tax=Diploscapter pachys TaxID=2018661 RepID=A0A2A2JJQ2_9BILA|nr:hypothetical protein WR25_23217 [Diploscapter pachys]